MNFLENHDQVDNSAYGIRGQHLTSPGRWRAMTALLLLMPGTPMLFHMFLEGEKEGLYHTADATLWFFHAINRYLAYSGDRLTLGLLYPTLKRIIDCHIRGTRFGIHVDERDGLLAEGAPGYQLTWMDAKVDDWVVTPRRGKPVEINALWFNALKLMEQWAMEQGDHAEAPFTPRGCIAQAWSVAEVLRVWVNLAQKSGQPRESSPAVAMSSSPS